MLRILYFHLDRFHLVCIVKKRSFLNQEPMIESTVNHLTLYVNGINNILTLNEIGVRKRICEFVIVLDTMCVSTKKSSKKGCGASVLFSVHQFSIKNHQSRHC